MTGACVGRERNRSGCPAVWCLKNVTKDQLYKQRKTERIDGCLGQGVYAPDPRNVDRPVVCLSRRCRCSPSARVCVHMIAMGSIELLDCSLMLFVQSLKCANATVFSLIRRLLDLLLIAEFDLRTLILHITCKSNVSYRNVLSDCRLIPEYEHVACLNQTRSDRSLST